MAETLATLAFLSALAMFLSPLMTKGKWLASVTVVFSLLALLLSPLEGIHQSGGSALVIVATMCGMIQYHINNGLNRKYLNGFGGAITFVLLLAMYPEDGIKETVNEYSITDGLICSNRIDSSRGILHSIAIQFDKIRQRNSIAIICIIMALFLISDVLISILFVVIISMCFIGFLPFFRGKNNLERLEPDKVEQTHLRFPH